MQDRHLATISKFTTYVHHLKGKAYVIPNTFSQVEIDQVSLAIDFGEPALAQLLDPEIGMLRTSVPGLIHIPGSQTQWSLEPLCLWTIHSHGSLRKFANRFPTPSTICPTPGVHATVRLISACFVWYSLNRDVSTWTCECLGSQFISQLWTNVAQTPCMISADQTTAYNTQSNRLVEQFHRQLNAYLLARLGGATWMDHLPWVLLGIRAAHKDDVGTSPAEMIFGVPLALPGQFCDLSGLILQQSFFRDLSQAVANLKPVSTSSHKPSRL